MARRPVEGSHNNPSSLQTRSLRLWGKGMCPGPPGGTCVGLRSEGRAARPGKVARRRQGSPAACSSSAGGYCAAGLCPSRNSPPVPGGPWPCPGRRRCPAGLSSAAAWSAVVSGGSSRPGPPVETGPLVTGSTGQAGAWNPCQARTCSVALPGGCALALGSEAGSNAQGGPEFRGQLDSSLAPHIHLLSKSEQEFYHLRVSEICLLAVPTANDRGHPEAHSPGP